MSVNSKRLAFRRRQLDKAEDFEESGSRTFMRRFSTMCNGCGVCTEACPEKAIDIKRESNPAKLADYPCSSACPAGIDAARYIRFVAAGRYDEATAVIREKMPFPAVCGYVCLSPCEDVCRRSFIDQPLLIRELKRAAAEYAGEEWKKRLTPVQPTGRRAAIIGSGPAGLTAAYFLARKGHDVTVFDALEEPGGKMRHSIRDWHLPKEILQREIDDICGIGVKIKTGYRVESADSLFDQGFETVLSAAGLHRMPQMPPVEAEADINGREFLDSAHSTGLVKDGSRVAIMGGGKIAFDCALKAQQEGASEIHLISIEYRCDGESEVRQSEKAFRGGAVVHSWRVFPRVVRDTSNHITGVEYYKMRAFGFDRSGRLMTEQLPGSERFIEADLVIDALGIKYNADCVYQRPGFFAAGDAVSELRSVIEAVAAGRWAAAQMDQYLGGDGVIDEQLAAGEENVLPVVCPSRAKRPEVETNMMPGGYAQVELTLPEATAREEAGRCLSCDLVYRTSFFNIDMSRCTRCGECVAACSREALSLETKASND